MRLTRHIFNEKFPKYVSGTFNFNVQSDFEAYWVYAVSFLLRLTLDERRRVAPLRFPPLPTGTVPGNSGTKCVTKLELNLCVFKCILVVYMNGNLVGSRYVGQSIVLRGCSGLRAAGMPEDIRVAFPVAFPPTCPEQRHQLVRRLGIYYLLH